MLSADQLQSELAQFTGTEAYHRLFIFNRKNVTTDGVKFLVDNGECYWLLDAISSHQKTAMKDEMLRDFQIWKLKVNSDKSAILTCERDTDDVAITQKIPYTDFPLPEITLYFERGGEDFMVLMLTNER